MVKALLVSDKWLSNSQIYILFLLPKTALTLPNVFSPASSLRVRPHPIETCSMRQSLQAHGAIRTGFGQSSLIVLASGNVGSD